MSVQDFSRIQIRLQMGQKLSYAERIKTVTTIEDALGTSESEVSKELLSDALIKAFRLAFSGL